MLSRCVNPVERRIQELASFRLGPRKRYIHAVRRRVVVPNYRYSWLLFEDAADREPVDTVVIDVDMNDAIDIDREVAEAFRKTLVVSIW